MRIYTVLMGGIATYAGVLLWIDHRNPFWLIFSFAAGLLAIIALFGIKWKK